jgi:DNA polymerase-1
VDKHSVVHVQTLEQARQAFRAFEESERFLAFDTETTGLYVRTPHGDQPRTVQFSWRPWEQAVVFEVSERWRLPIETFFSASWGIVGHNVKFDLHAMANFGIDLNAEFDPLNVHDTVWLARLHDERDSAKLKPLATKYLRDTAADEQARLKRLMAKNGWDWATVPVRYLIEYGGLDAIVTGQLFDLFMPQIGYALDAYEREQRLQPIIYRMERAGLKVDTAMLAEVLEEERRLETESFEKLQALAPGLNPNAPHQIKRTLRDRGHDVADTQAATLKALAGEDEFAAALLEYRKHQKTAGTYAEPWTRLITPEGRIHPNLNTMGAATGRFSSSDPNLQNITRGHRLRDIFMAGPGNVLVVADWNQMELRLYAHFAEDEVMRSAFLDGEDIYQGAADLLDVPRQVGKMVMLASIYGAGPKTLKRQCIAQAYQYGMEELVPLLLTYDWDALHRKFHARYKIKDLARLTELAARRRGMVGEPYVLTLGGRRQRPKAIKMPPVNGHRQTVYTYKDLGNSLVQGSSSDLMKQAILDAEAEGLGPFMRLTVHDELILEVPEHEVERVTDVLRKVMTRNEFIPPLTIETAVAERYGQAK